jgi:hypothetical protein
MNDSDDNTLGGRQKYSLEDKPHLTAKLAPNGDRLVWPNPTTFRVYVPTGQRCRHRRHIQQQSQVIHFRMVKTELGGRLEAGQRVDGS